MSVPHIAHVTIKNFRNFEELDIDTEVKQLIIGENATGKSNYIKALRLILDPTMSEQDRFLTSGDFSNTVLNPMELGKEIEISVYIDDYQDNKALMCIIGDAIVSLDGRNLAKITYKFGPIDKTSPLKGYQRGIRTYETNTRNTFDISSIPIIKTETSLPIFADLSHSLGRKDIINPIAKAILAMGADGIMVEVHLYPELAFSDNKR